MPIRRDIQNSNPYLDEEGEEMTREEIFAMDINELSLAVAEKVFQAKIIGKEDDPNAKLLIGWYGVKAWQPMRSSWTSAHWSPSEEIAWMDCPRFSEDISAAWKVVDIVQEKYTLDFSLNRHIHQFEMMWISRFYDFDIDPIRVVSDTAPKSICKAALLAVLEATP